MSFFLFLKCSPKFGQSVNEENNHSDSSKDSLFSIWNKKNSTSLQKTWLGWGYLLQWLSPGSKLMMMMMCPHLVWTKYVLHIKISLLNIIYKHCVTKKSDNLAPWTQTVDLFFCFTFFCEFGAKSSHMSVALYTSTRKDLFFCKQIISMSPVWCLAEHTGDKSM